jgi:uncharacterized membrane protein
MRSLYNRIVGQNLDRLTALSDGVFSVAMTLLVIDLKTPAAEAMHSEHDLWTALLALAPRLVTYLMSFLTLGIFWLGQQAQLDRAKHSDRDLMWLHIAFLCAVTLVPFSTSLLAEFFTYRVALIVYWANILLLGLLLLATWRHAVRGGLLREDVTPVEVNAICRRVTIAQTLYACGAALCFFNTYWSIGFIVLIQLYYAIGPPLWGRRDRGLRGPGLRKTLRRQNSPRHQVSPAVFEEMWAGVGAHRGSHTLGSQHLEQERARHTPVDDVHRTHAFTHGLQRGCETGLHAARDHVVANQRVAFGGGHDVDELAVPAVDAVDIGHQHQLLGLERPGYLSGKMVRVDVIGRAVLANTDRHHHRNEIA